MHYYYLINLEINMSHKNNKTENASSQSDIHFDSTDHQEDALKTINKLNDGDDQGDSVGGSVELREG